MKTSRYKVRLFGLVVLFFIIIGCSSKNSFLPVLTETEKMRPYAKYYSKELAKIPEDILLKIRKGPCNPEDVLLFENKNDLLKPGYLPVETGYCRMPNGSYFVSVLTKMPGVTAEMLDWWFWWHAMDPLRYKIWYPNSHQGISVDDFEEYKNRRGPYRERYWHSTHYPVEDVGVGSEELFIKFVPPEEFGFDVAKFNEANVATIVCAYVGSVGKKLQHTYMCHFVRRIETGLEMRSRFWIGHTVRFTWLSEESILNNLVNNRLFRKIAIPEDIGYHMAKHCAQEYNNLAIILPELFNVYHEQDRTTGFDRSR